MTRKNCRVSDKVIWHALLCGVLAGYVHGNKEGKKSPSHWIRGPAPPGDVIRLCRTTVPAVFRPPGNAESCAFLRIFYQFRQGLSTKTPAPPSRRRKRDFSPSCSGRSENKASPRFAVEPGAVSIGPAAFMLRGYSLFTFGFSVGNWMPKISARAFKASYSVFPFSASRFRNRCISSFVIIFHPLRCRAPPLLWLYYSLNPATSQARTTFMNSFGIRATKDSSLPVTGSVRESS